MKCSDCGYWWKESWDDFPGCHFVGPHQWAPCEQEDDYVETDDVLNEDEYVSYDDDSWDNDD